MSTKPPFLPIASQLTKPLIRFGKATRRIIDVQRNTSGIVVQAISEFERYDQCSGEAEFDWAQFPQTTHGKTS